MSSKIQFCERFSFFNFSLSFCGISNSSGDSAISTAHSQSEISSSKEFRLSFIFRETMATLEDLKPSYRQNGGIFNDEDDEESQKSFSSVNESLNLSQFSSGTSNFESGKASLHSEIIHSSLKIF